MHKDVIMECPSKEHNSIRVANTGFQELNLCVLWYYQETNFTLPFKLPIHQVKDVPLCSQGWYLKFNAISKHIGIDSYLQKCKIKNNWITTSEVVLSAYSFTCWIQVVINNLH